MCKTLCVISLGCDKNRVDTENILYLLSAKFTLENDLSKANVIIVNTCAFIESARAEAIDTILDCAQYKNPKNGVCEKLVVCGCLAQKYANEIKDDLPEVDAFVGTKDYAEIVSIIETLFANNKSLIRIESTNCLDFSERILTTPPHYAYLKIADGCNNFCTFCTIPSIRGKYVSRPMESLVREASGLVDNGVKEIILIAQDVTRYGQDLYGKSELVTLIKELSKLDVKWIRLMYCYPELVTNELIAEIDNNDKVAKYIDIPIQHADDSILKLMNRKSSAKSLSELLYKIKTAKNYIAIRSTFMVGFPSETDDQFNNLYKFLKEYKLDNVGVFAYSLEEDTPSAKISGQVPQEKKLERVNKIGRLNLKNAIERNKKLVGKTITVLYEDVDYERNMFKGRTQYNAPEIDTFVYFTADFVDVGNFYDVEITGCDGYDLLGKLVTQ